MEDQIAQVSVDATTQIALTIILAFTMLSVAIGIRPTDFLFIKKHPFSLIIGSFAQLVALPALTLLLVKLLAVSPALALGMIIIACCPGGNMSNLLTRLSNGDTAYSVSLTLVSSVFSAAVLPLAILFWVSLHAPADALIETVQIDRFNFVLRTSVILLIPLALGILIAHYKPVAALRLQRYCLPASVFFLTAIIIVSIIDNADTITSIGLDIVPIVILHNGAGFALGALFGFLTLKNQSKARALTIEVGIQNAGLGLIIIIAELGGFGEAAVMVGMWGIWHLIGGLIVAGLFRGYDARTAVREKMHADS